MYYCIHHDICVKLKIDHGIQQQPQNSPHLIITLQDEANTNLILKMFPFRQRFDRTDVEFEGFLFIVFIIYILNIYKFCQIQCKW